MGLSDSGCDIEWSSRGNHTAEGVTLYIGREAAQALVAIRPAQQLLDASKPVFGLSPRQIGRRVPTAARSPGITRRIWGNLTVKCRHCLGGKK